MKHCRAADEYRIAEDQLQAVVVREVLSGRQTELTGVPGDDVPVPPGPLGELEADVLACLSTLGPSCCSNRSTGYTGTQYSELDFLYAGDVWVALTVSREGRDDRSPFSAHSP